MNINTKICLIIVTALVVTAAGLGSLAIWQIDTTGDMAVGKIEKVGKTGVDTLRTSGGEQVKAYRQQLLTRKKEYLKSQVQTVMGVLEKAYKDAHDPAKLKLIYQDQLENAVNTAYGVLAAVYGEKDLSEAQKQAKAIDLIKQLRYGTGDKGYFWINDMHPTMLMHPFKAELDGADLSDYKDPAGKRLFVEMVKVCRDDGQGFVTYKWSKYSDSKPQPRLSFVKLFKPWNWVIGSGLYLEVAEQEQQADAIAIIKSLRYGPEDKDYFWINDLHPKMIMHPFKPELDGKDLSEVTDPGGKRMFVEMAKVCREAGQGYVEYQWPKPGKDKPQPKLSYVQLFKPWNWIIGTGLYIDDINALATARQAKLSKDVKASEEGISREIAATNTAMRSRTHGVIREILLVTLAVLVVIVALSYLYTRGSITRPVRQIIELLNRGADQMAAAANQVAASSQSLAEGSSEHAAAIEQTSSSLNEIDAMTRQNAEHANEANNLMKAANQVVEQANASMTDLTHSMEEISLASEETSKIIKTIDEIAFQTNLLALNAAVEAARAGEAGAGFAVVADEVRNLALRAADAAKNTAALIEGTVKKIKEGGMVVTRTNEDFAMVAESAAKVGALVTEIAAASDEQVQGINQVNVAAAEMDKLIQQNAANAEESASAAEEMHALAEQLRGVVIEIAALVGSSSSDKDPAQKAKSAPASSKPAFAGRDRERNVLPERRQAGERGRSWGAGNAPRSNAEEIIPLDDEFEDF